MTDSKNDLIIPIVVTYNGSNWIEKCLSSLIRNVPEYDIIVIDNNSSDDTVSIIESRYSSITLIKSAQNIGFGNANNIGLKIAYSKNANYILLLNQDSWIQHETISVLIKLCKSDLSIGILAPMNLNTDGTALEKGCEQELNPLNCPGILSDLYLKKTKEVYYINNYINASCWLVTGDCLKKTGAFEPLFSHYGEDVNYCMRAKYNGFKIGVALVTNNYHAKDNFVSKLNEQEVIIKKLRSNYLNSGILIKLTDLNQNYKKVFAYEVRLLVYQIFKDLIKLRMAFVKGYLGILFFVLSNYNRMRHHRQLYLTGDSPFLK